MKNILDRIVAVKKKEVEHARTIADPAELNRKCISLKENLMAANSTGIIAEFKRRSPSKGWFKGEDFSAPAVVKCYEQFGAAGVSILTDKEFFGGELADITACRTMTRLPILRKDFIIHEIQVQEAKAHGADVILLIAAILSPKRVQELAVEAKKYGLEVLLELHGENELDHICHDIDMVGINNRNLQTFEVDINHSIRLSKQLPADKVKIAESGIDDIETIKRFKDAGFKGFLIGEKFMKEPDPGIAFEQFVQKLKQG
jgi:indole-3-glycerol phosphate synthase